MKRLLIFAILFVPLICMADTQVATDNCTRANGAIGANWTVAEGTWSVSNNTCIISASTPGNEAAWTHDAFTNDQYSSVTFAGTSGSWNAGVSVGPAVRMSGKNGYVAFCSVQSGSTPYNCTSVVVAKDVNGTNTTLFTYTGQTIAPGTTLTLKVVGHMLYVFAGATQISTPIYDTNAFSSGSAGMIGRSTFTSSTGVTSWAGGNVSVAPMGIAPICTNGCPIILGNGNTSAFDTTNATLFVAACHSQTTIASNAMADSKSNIWQATTQQGNAGAPAYTRIFYVYNPTTSATHTFSCAVSTASGSEGGLEVGLFIGTDITSAVFDQRSGANATQPGSLTPTNAWSLFAVASTDPGDNAANVSAPFSVSNKYTDGNNAARILAFYAETTPTGSQNPTITYDVGGGTATEMVTFNPNSGAAPTRHKVVVVQ